MAQGTTGRALVRDPMSKLTDDLLLEILSRLSYKSSCRCKCVSTRWRDLIAHPDSRKKMPQTLAGFFNIVENPPKCVRCYIDLSKGVYPRFDRPLSFVLPEREDLDMHDSCNGLLLVWNRTTEYVVCNLVTEKMVTVPAPIWSDKVGMVYLGFDPAVSSHFHVFEFIPACVWDAESVSGEESMDTKAIGIYSSKAGAWTYRCIWDSHNSITISIFSRSAFLNGVLYVSSYEKDYVIAVDVKGNWRVIHIPTPHSPGDVHNVYLSQGKLHLAYKSGYALSIWVLEDSSSDNWTLKRNISHLQLLGNRYSSYLWNYEVASIHPEHDTIFIVRIYKTGRLPRTLLSYDMDSFFIEKI